MNSPCSNVKDGQVNDLVATVIPTQEINVVTTLQNLEQSSVGRNMYPHGIIDYYNPSCVPSSAVTATDSHYVTATTTHKAAATSAPEIHRQNSGTDIKGPSGPIIRFIWSHLISSVRSCCPILSQKPQTAAWFTRVINTDQLPGKLTT
ncbi:hypothetical protein WN943_027402 [Citrus x changshan-huyou]